MCIYALIIMMKTVIFVCHGNICRSVAAEYIMKNLLIKYHLEDKFFVLSRATSLEEIGNDIYPPMKRALYNKEIPFYQHRATRITKEDYNKADYIYYMDSHNRRNLSYLLHDERKIIFPITMYNPEYSEIDDPWYTGQFDEVIEQLTNCIENIIKYIK